MNWLRYTAVAATTLLLAGCGSPSAPATATPPAPPPAAAAQATTLDLSPLEASIDTNHDGCMSHEEWQAAGAPESAYQMLKDEKGCVTDAAMHRTAAPDGIDLNGDGKLTLEEMKAFDRAHAPGAAKP